MRMRTLLAIALCAGGILALHQTAEAGDRHRRAAPHDDGDRPDWQSRAYREQIECERARHFDPTGRYSGYPCWAAAALGEADESGSNDNR